MKKLYLHIGTNKTGSTSIQRVLARNGDVLSREGFLYPITGRHGGAHHRLGAALGFRHQNQQPDPAQSLKFRKQLRSELRRSRCQSVVISSENFVLDGPVEVAAEFFKDFDVRVVVYLRRHDHWLLSCYGEALKGSAKPAWKSGLRGYVRRALAWDPVCNYRRLVDRWASVFGKERILLRPYEPNDDSESLVGDFFKTVGCRATLSDLVQQPGRLNAAWDYQTLQMLEAIRRAKLPADLVEGLAAFIASQAREPDAGEDPMPPTLRSGLVQRNKEDYAYLATTYLGREDGRLFQEADPDPGQPWKKPKPFEAERLVEVVVKFLSRDSAA